MRSFNGSLEALSDYIVDAIHDPAGASYGRHTAWKDTPVEQWQPGFLKLASRPKSGVFCELCDWAASKAQHRVENNLFDDAGNSLAPVVENCSSSDKEYEKAAAGLSTMCLKSNPSFSLFNQPASSPICLKDLVVLAASSGAASSQDLARNMATSSTGVLRDACAELLLCPPRSNGLDCSITGLAECISNSWEVFNLWLSTLCDTAYHVADNPVLAHESGSISTNEQHEAAVVATANESVFYGFDMQLESHLRLPCPHEGNIVVSAASLSSYLNLDLVVPMSSALAQIVSFDRFYHNFLRQDFHDICALHHSEPVVDDGECLRAMTSALYHEVGRICLLPASESNVSKRSLRVNSLGDVVAERPLDSYDEVHVIVANDADCQRFFHLIFAELLPVVSLALRLTAGSSGFHESSVAPPKRIYIYSSTRKWRLNPLHKLYDDLNVLGRGSFEILLVDKAGPAVHLKTAARSLGPIGLPRWDFVWWGHDQQLALEGARFVEALARRELGMPERGNDSGPGAVVFQLRNSDNAELSGYYKSLHNELLSSGVSNFGNQDYSK